MRQYGISYQKDDGYKIHFYDIPAWKYYVEIAWDALCEATQGWIGGHGMPEIFWKIPVGKPDYDDKYDILDNSVAALLVGLESRILCDLCDWNPHKIHTIFVDVEEARIVAPDFVRVMEGDDDDTEDDGDGTTGSESTTGS